MRALSAEHRRQILFALHEKSRVEPFPDDGSERERTIRLLHVHRPHLTENDLVAWDPDTGVVRRGAQFETVEPLLTALDTGDDVLPGEPLPEDRQIC